MHLGTQCSQGLESAVRAVGGSLFPGPSGQADTAQAVGSRRKKKPSRGRDGEDRGISRVALPLIYHTATSS